MKTLAKELVLGVFEHLEPESLKACRNVCWQWSNAATQLLFQHVVLSRKESSKHLTEILMRYHLSSPIKIISFTSELKNEVGVYLLLGLIVDRDNMRNIWSLPTSCVIHQQQTIFVANFIGSHLTDTRVPNLREICTITPDLPYILCRPFRNLRKIHIIAESVQLPMEFKIPRLEELHITSHVIGTDLLTDFLRCHRTVKQVYLTSIISFPLENDLVHLMMQCLQTGMSDDLATVIIKDAKEEACGKSQVFFKSVYREINIKFDEISAKALNEEFATLFKLLQGLEEKRRRDILGGVWSVVKSPDVIIFAAEYQEGLLPWLETSQGRSVSYRL